MYLMGINDYLDMLVKEGFNRIKGVIKSNASGGTGMNESKHKQA